MRHMFCIITDDNNNDDNASVAFHSSFYARDTFIRFQATFKSFSPYWENDLVYNVDDGLTSIHTEEAKFRAFSEMSFSSLCLEMDYYGTKNWIHLPYNATSLKDIFTGSVYKPTALGRSVWKSLVPGSSLQLNCNREGFNVNKDNGLKFVRIGIMGSNNLNCGSAATSYIGFGGKWNNNNVCDPLVLGVSCGNSASCNADNGEKMLSTFGYILIQ